MFMYAPTVFLNMQQLMKSCLPFSDGTEVVLRGEPVNDDTIANVKSGKSLGMDVDVSSQIAEAEKQKINGLDFGFKFDD